MSEQGNFDWRLISAAHELKAPLVAMRQMAFYVEKEIDESNLSSQGRRILQQMVQSSDQALRLTTDLTRASRISSVDDIFLLEPVNAYAICGEVVREYLPVARSQKRQIVFKHRLHTTNMIVVAHRDFLRRILANFADNALKYSGEFSRIEIGIVSEKNREKVIISVRDIGEKIPAKMWKNVQSLLKNPHEKNTDVSLDILAKNGFASGIGLYICRQFAEAMHGEIGAKRHRDGTTFFVRIPASKQMSFLEL